MNAVSRPLPEPAAKRAHPRGRVRRPTRLRGLARMFAGAMGVALLGYAFLGRGFSYIGVPPFFLDSALFLLALMLLVSRPGWLRLLGDPSGALLAFFMFWGAARTVPHVGQYGIDALRDAVIWAWGIFAFAIAYLFARAAIADRALGWYARYMGWLPLWAPIALSVYWFMGSSLPRFPWGPGGGVPVLNPKGGDIAVHLAGFLAFGMLLAPGLTRVPVPIRALSWPGWALSFAFVGFTGRAAFLTIAAPALLLMLLRVELVRWLRATAVVTAFLVLFAMSGLELRTPSGRSVSFEQLVTNVASIFGEVPGFSGEGSKAWRVAWWETIVNYTFFGEYFWTGKGFGVNLANDDGFQVLGDNSLRSPHNGHLTVLARMGVPGFLLWAGFLLLLLLRLMADYFRWLRRRDALQAGLRLTLLVYLSAAIINATFDVYLEGPHGGIWFWSLVGAAIGLVARDRPSVLRPRLRPRSPAIAYRRGKAVAGSGPAAARGMQGGAEA